MSYEKITPELQKAIGVDNIAFVVAVDFNGNPTVLENGDGTKDDLESSFPCKELVNVYTATFVAVANSHCVCYIDSTGRRRCVCL